MNTADAAPGFDPADAPALAWSDEFASGHAAVDDKHREFIVLVNALVSADDASLLDALHAFERHAQEHFAQEDALMRGNGYPSAGCHLEEHQAVLASIAQVIPLVAAGNLAIGRDLADALVGWFPEHTEEMDKSLTRWLFKQQAGGAALVFRRGGRPAPRKPKPLRAP